MTCKYLDCGWCYAPSGVKTNNSQGECIHPECCPYLKSQMPNPEIIVERKKYGNSDAMDYTIKVFQRFDENTVTIDGVKYKRVEEPKPTILYDIIADWWDEIFINHNPSGQNIESLVDTIESEWLPDPDDGGDRYSCGWNDCVEKLKLRLRG